MPGIVNDDLRLAIAAIDRVHGDGDLPAMTMMTVLSVPGDQQRQRDGAFVARSPGEDLPIIASAILIRRGGPHKPFVTVHEVGHFLDLCGLPGPTFSSRNHPDLARWRDATFAGRAFHELEALVDSPHAGTARRAADLLAIEELWARSYAQFVAKRSSSLPLLTALNAIGRQQPDDLYYPRHWDDDDFVGVESAIDELFRGMEWIV